MPTPPSRPARNLPTLLFSTKISPSITATRNPIPFHRRNKKFAFTPNPLPSTPQPSRPNQPKKTSSPTTYPHDVQHIMPTENKDGYQLHGRVRLYQSCAMPWVWVRVRVQLWPKKNKKGDGGGGLGWISNQLASQLLEQLHGRFQTHNVVA